VRVLLLCCELGLGGSLWRGVWRAPAAAQCAVVVHNMPCLSCAAAAHSFPRYGGYTFRDFDIANHFTEYAGFEGDYSRWEGVMSGCDLSGAEGAEG
jgi:hypothetical protein